MTPYVIAALVIGIILVLIAVVLFVVYFVEDIDVYKRVRAIVLHPDAIFSSSSSHSELVRVVAHDPLSVADRVRAQSEPLYTFRVTGGGSCHSGFQTLLNDTEAGVLLLPTTTLGQVHLGGGPGNANDRPSIVVRPGESIRWRAGAQGEGVFILSNEIPVLAKSMQPVPQAEPDWTLWYTGMFIRTRLSQTQQLHLGPALDVARDAGPLVLYCPPSAANDWVVNVWPGDGIESFAAPGSPTTAINVAPGTSVALMPSGQTWFIM